MKRQATLVTITLVLATGAAFAGDVDPGLQAIMDQTPPDEPISALMYLHEQLDHEGITAALDAQNATLAERHHTVVTNLHNIADRTQGNLVATLDTLLQDGRIASYDAYWVANFVRVDAPAAELQALAARPDIHVAYFNYEIESITPIGPVVDTTGRTMLTPEKGLEAIRAPEVWNDLGFDGTGVLVCTLDTGVDGNHPAVASRWRGLDPRYADNPEWAFFDPVLGRNFPADLHGHGTHTMGTVCGGAPGDEIGVAPGAEWIHAATLIDAHPQRFVADSLRAFQWCIDPDGNPNTHWDVPTSCSNSWNLKTSQGYPPCDQTFWQALDNCEAAGIVIIFAAGNEGPIGLLRPADRATTDYNTMAVAAVDANNPSWPVASFSSRGPTNCTPNGDPAIKPDIAGPGVEVRSAWLGSQYARLSGTSMSTPHINGVVALMRQADPNISVNDVKQIIYDTAYDLGFPGEDNDYGWGMVDAYEAVLRASGVVPSCMNLKVDNLVAGQTATFTVTKNIIRREYVAIVWGTGGNGSVYNNVAGFCADFGFKVPGPSRIVAQGYVDQNDEFVANVKVPGGLSGFNVKFQATKRDTCPDPCMSGVVDATVQ